MNTPAKIRHRRGFCIPLRFIVVLLGIVSSLHPIVATQPTRSIIIYGGRYTDSGLTNIVFKRETDYKNSYLAVAGYNRELDGNLRMLNFEAEGQVGAHFGKMKHMEYNGLLIARIKHPYDLPFSFAFGEGLSLATKHPDLEETDSDPTRLQFNSQKTNPLLNYLMLEVELSKPRNDWTARPFLRIHHRSGVFGTYCPPICGSNFVSYGVKFSL